MKKKKKKRSPIIIATRDLNLDDPNDLCSYGQFIAKRFVKLFPKGLRLTKGNLLRWAKRRTAHQFSIDLSSLLSNLIYVPYLADTTWDNLNDDFGPLTKNEQITLFLKLMKNTKYCKG